MRQVLLIFIIINFIGCNKKSKNNIFIDKSYEYSLVKSKSVDLNLSVDEYGKSYLDYYQKSEESSLLYRKGRFENSVVIYDWKQKKRIKKVNFRYEGPNKIANYDQAALLPLDNKDHYFIGSVGHIYETFGDSVIHHIKSIKSNLSDDGISGNADVFFINGRNFNPPFKYNSSIYVKTSSSIGDLGSDEYYSSSQLLKYDLETKKYKQLNISYPKLYYNKCWGPGRLRISYTFNPQTKKLVYLFPAKPTIYVYDLEKEKIIDSVFIKNKYYSKLMPISCSMPTEKQFQHIYSTPSFNKIVYNQYQDIYYMFVNRPITIEKFKSVDNPFGLKPITILVLDNNFKIIAEKEIEGGIYFASEFFVTEEGLWISKYNPFNEELKEDILTFDLFKLRENGDK